MPRPFSHIEVEQHGDVTCVQFRNRYLDESGIHALADELFTLVRDEGHSKLALVMGPDKLEFMYSIFLSKLVTLRRLVTEKGGRLVLCNASPLVREVFAVSRLEDLFEFAPDKAGGIATLSKPKA